MVETAAPADVRAELDAGAEVLAWDEEHGTTALHCAAASGVNQPSAIEELLLLGVTANTQDEYGFTAYELAQRNEKIKGTESYWALHRAVSS